jgi:hypothetical protein
MGVNQPNPYRPSQQCPPATEEQKAKVRECITAWLVQPNSQQGFETYAERI